MVPEVIPFLFEHIDQLDIQDRQAPDVAWLRSVQESLALEEMSSYTVRAGARVLACGGVFEINPWRGFAWALLAKSLGHDFIYVHRVSARLFAAVPYARIEYEVDIDFDAGHRWARMLGFEMETARVRKYREDGSDVTRYVMVR